MKNLVAVIASMRLVFVNYAASMVSSFASGETLDWDSGGLWLKWTARSQLDN
jgi:hypothetical protein